CLKYNGGFIFCFIQIGGVLQPVDEVIRLKIRELVLEGVTSVQETKRHLDIFVAKDLFLNKIKPKKNNRRFYPHINDIRNHMYLATMELRHSKIDQNDLEAKIQIWKDHNPDDHYFFRPCVGSYTSQFEQTNVEVDNIFDNIAAKNNDHSNNLLFVHQTHWQQHLLNKYGNEICLLDATYKTMRYALPLFFVCVKTNVDYKVVGTFICQCEDSFSIKEALHILKSWNSKWSPSYFMTDYSEAEINAIESVFQGCHVYLCDFHREQAWERWARTVSHGVSGNREDIRSKLRRIARASLVSEYETAVCDLKLSKVWKSNKQLQNWFERNWLNQSKRWVWCFRKTRFNVMLNTNNGVERQNRSLKHEYLSSQER
ncbi:uncharacterized protein LOC121386837, partial [Gigantopelta aegis]|uniref:uncharacterized protein LOC121386837 n=1 Tax=Gigantopelta aegis TaxID=1735272 RepID=UPI001B8885F2